MQVTQTLAEGLKREFRVTVPAADLDSKVATRLEDLKTKVQINGFRPGKVPLAHLKKVYGSALFGEVLQEIMTEANRRIVEEGEVKLATQPKVSLPEEESEILGVLSGTNDLDYKVELEVMPQIEVGDLKTLKLEKPVAPVTGAEVDEALKQIARQNKAYEDRAEGVAAENGDRVTVDFVGTIDDVAFEGGTAQDIPVDLGSNTFIPGFEEQLVGIKVGETRTVKAPFPPNYQKQELAGKEASFEVTAKSIAAPQERTIDDELATTLGLESLDKLKEAVREQIERQHNEASRGKLKRAMLDALDKIHSFELPPSLVEQEFSMIWDQVGKGIEQSGESEGKSADELKADYHKIAERRVRLGLLLAQIGERADIKVPDEEVSRAILERARQFSGGEQQVWDYYRKNPDAIQEIRAPLFEEKVVDYIAELANVSEKTVTREQLFAEDPETEAAG